MTAWHPLPPPPDRNPAQFEEHIGPGLSLLRLRDPADTPECPHGRLPLDRPKAHCNCWDGFLRVRPRVEKPARPAPVLSPLKCACGCGQFVRPGRAWVSGHNPKKRAA
jgi:hypothetical protein